MANSIYDRQFDVIVAGGGVSGCAAAVAAARCGADVLVVEQGGYLGGTLTSCGVGPMMTFHAGEKQVIRGFMQEVVDALVNRGYSPGHVPDTKQYTDTVTPFNAEGLKLVLDELLTSAGATLLFHSFIGAVNREGDRLTGLTVCNKDGLNSIKAKVIIDATGDGDIAAWAGAVMTRGRPEDGAAQPMTMKMKYCNVNTKVLKAHVLMNLEDFPQMREHADLLRRDIPMDLEGFSGEVAQAKAAGELEMARENILMFATDREGEYILNTTRIIEHDATSAASLSDAELVGRRQCDQLDRFMRKYVPGFKNALLEFTGPSVGVRGSRQLVGRYTLTAADILACRRFDSVIAHSGYPIDIHNPKGEGTTSTFLNERGSYYDIPLEVMICEEIANLVVTGRCCSATFEAQASLRLSPSAGAMGQAAGVAAAQAASKGGDVSGVDVAAVQAALREQGAYLEVR
ncbi:FAD-dependent oxidoreductase [Marasmitruncus massiliensis]|uniref:FAD-dependent oxidoreductase n=1 Tax=Marasmitruncus massiliensis TaxID=1944642 RepID=UPI000C7E6580|nr:FAD-dependent oxidoreductase [Marasmitruncus massiliensis]